MPNFYDYLKECENINIYCFDMKQYDPEALEMSVVVMLNYQGLTYTSTDIRICVPDFCLWIDTKWVVAQGEDIIKVKGCQEIVDMIEEGETGDG